jgi:hypothetical protein
MKQCQRLQWPNRGLLWGLLVCLWAQLGCSAMRLGSRPDIELEDPAALGKTVVTNPLALPGVYSHRVSQYVFNSDFKLRPSQPLFDELSAMRDTIYKELQLPPANTLIQVYLFESRDRYEKFMQHRYPELPRRRAFFISQPRAVAGSDELLVYTFWGDHIRQDLRHELTHALLHAVLRDVPLWLDEGLAEYFELPPSNKGVNYAHLEKLRRGNPPPNLPRLEQLSQVQQMAPEEYREAWAWVHLMLHSTPAARNVLLGYLQQLRTSNKPGLLAPSLAVVMPSLNEAFREHLLQLERNALPPPRAW